MASPVFPEPPSDQAPTPLPDCDAALQRLSDAAPRWAALGFPERAALLRRAMADLNAVAEEWVEAACRAKGHTRNSVGEGEEWLAGVMPVMRNLRMLAEAMDQRGQPALPGTSQRPDGQWVARVFPSNAFEKVLFAGIEAEVRIEPGQQPTQGQIYRDKSAGTPGEGGVGLVLGAGNQASIGPMDVLYKLFVDDEVVALKMNPVNAYLGPFIERAFKGFVEQGYFAVLFGGAQVGKHLCQHPQVDSIHITGSNRTHDAIVWGPDPGQQERKDRGERVNDKPITSELGAVTPVMVTPGRWSASELDFQARHIVSMVTQNASFNCNAGKVLVVAKGWELKDQLLERVAAHLDRAPLRKAYYPGANARHQGFLDRYPQARMFGEASEQVVPWTLLPQVPAQADEYALNTEAFCGVLAVVELDCAEPVDFLEKVVPFANDHIWGTLSCVLLVHPRTRKAHRQDVERAVDGLRYGAIGVNAWTGALYGLVAPTWGAFPGHPLEDIRSGRGVVHNSFLLDHPQKSIITAPFTAPLTPAWYGDHKQLTALGRRVTAFEADPSWRRVPGLAVSSVRG